MLVEIVFLVLLRIILLTDVFPLKLQHVRIPPYKFRGESALLECQYELANGNNNGHTQQHRPRPRFDIFHDDDYYSDGNDGDPLGTGGGFSPGGGGAIGGAGAGGTTGSTRTEKLYSVKWYKDNEEFYRYVPSANPAIRSFKVDGIRVDPNHSDNSKVFLRQLSLKSSGVYRCEISAEAPNFDSVQGEGRLDVIYIPKDGPHISGDRDARSYHMGETLELNCTSGRSYPASTLQWFINDEPVTDSELLIPYPRFQNPHGLITSFLGLNVIVGPHHYERGIMRIKCVASLSPVLWREGKESILQWEQPTFDNREAMLLVKSGAQSWKFSINRYLNLGSLTMILVKVLL
ncbi:uncharacterized protein LOC129756856 [Uranotaenia lowii]|uniref:uncharacterized protein LOC129756856 n=1 Tax=Uranotaenia lowii TaxID=190385 RepID=UPI00247B20F9|nr:uncharacterized protein LOC129756856 [Uranotaenia lowii]XP_055609865.1 uncharacterized protein LOC129756856 [Uranotaenia lowii]XP_055609866.1 uncharacterized protein LOC129756856 [Uranotaenia lowii]XP_055609868.1 uncharacterized protein LOC129756856 [Uranotaenia lowii]XP_055609869.1 uncharacterized protein LOC129756856 [Uranotaenia lowii]XP_055609870.1 uncharacterized protein LOC129756856 [Uranotaenia lowii]